MSDTKETTEDHCSPNTAERSARPRALEDTELQAAACAEARAGWVLVVDDERPVRLVIRRMLEDAGYSVLEASSLDDAVDRYAYHDVRVLVYDLIQPGWEPTSAFSAARAAFLGARVLAISGGGRAGATPLLETASRLGASATLAKPFARVALLAAVELLWPAAA